jgi:DNA-binding beta-propeller fold protein YncE
MNSKAKTFAMAAVFASVTVAGFTAKRFISVGPTDSGGYKLPNGWTVTKVGRVVDLPGDFPQDIAFLENGKQAIVNTAGFHDHSVNLIDLESAKIVDSKLVPTAWIGLDASDEKDIWVSAGQPSSGEMVRRFSVEKSSLNSTQNWSDTSLNGKSRFVSSILRVAEFRYVLNAQTDELLEIDATGSVKRRTKTDYRPYGIACSPDLDTLAVSNWGDQSISLIDRRTFKLRKKVAVGSLPSGLSYHPDGRLFVAVSGADYVSTILPSGEERRTKVGIGIDAQIGSSPVSVTVSQDRKRAYVANAGNNCVTVLDVTGGEEKVAGFIPTDRYPSLAKESPDGKKLVIGTAKGEYGPNAGKNVSLDGAEIRGRQYGVPYRYLPQSMKGRLAILDVPSSVELAKMTEVAKEGALVRQREAEQVIDSQEVVLENLKKIKHVIYVIRENRTYDQVFGDMPRGNGDPSLCLFGEEVTPNSHQLAKDFILFDNLFADGECSQCGHQWTDAGYANDYCEKQWVLSYSRRAQIQSDTRLTSSPGEYIWTQARKQGLTARVYGEYVDVQEDHNSLQPEKIKADPEKYGYSATWEKIFARDGRDTEKVDDFIRELKIAEKTGVLPNLMVMALPDDHTNGFSPGSFSPKAMIADNDLALGRLVDAVSHSRFWKEAAIFVIQDDAQDGPDHVDGHRTVAHFISPYTRVGKTDSTHYTTSSMLRTIGLILGTTPLSQYDLIAPPMIVEASVIPNYAPFNCVAPKYNLEERNPKSGKLAEWSKTLDFSEIDRADFDSLNRLLWAGYRPGVPFPENPTAKSK